MESKGESKYERLRKIGIGSYGVVFKCVNRQTGQIVAIKRYSENDTDPIIRKIAMREVRMLRQLKHPNLIHLIEVFRRKRRLHLVFDYCELTVLDVIEKYTNNCPLNLIRKIIWQLVNGVSHCHSHNCIHRDIKPENILINQSGVVKLCDFGFARSLNPGTKLMLQSQSTIGTLKQQLEREAQLLGVPSSQVSQWANGSGACTTDKENVAIPLKAQQANDTTGTRQALTEYVATRWYRAPELLVGEIYYDTKIDIWAIGCVTAELMRGEPLWPGKTDLDQLQMIRSSLGPLTSSQAHTLSTQNIYDQVNIERLLSNQPVQNASSNSSEPLERKLPARFGPLGLEFVLLCLQMDPASRPASEHLLQHGYIQSARMNQFVRGTAGAHLNGPSAASSQAQALATGAPSNRSSTSSSSPPPPSQQQQQQQSTLIPSLSGRRLNSQQALLLATASQQASKRLVLASDSSTSSTTTTTTKAKRGSLLPIATARRQLDNVAPREERHSSRQYKRKLPAVATQAAANRGGLSQPAAAVALGGTPSVRMDRDLHEHQKASKLEAAARRQSRNHETLAGVDKFAEPNLGNRSLTYKRLTQSNGNLQAGNQQSCAEKAHEQAQQVKKVNQILPEAKVESFAVANEPKSVGGSSLAIRQRPAAPHRQRLSGSPALSLTPLGATPSNHSKSNLSFLPPVPRN